MTPEVLERERPYLLGVAYRLLGSAADAEDVVQEALVRGGALDDVRSPRAMLTTIVTRLCLDELRSARRRREAYVGPWLPEPVLTGEPPDDAPDARVASAESVSFGFLLLLETLTPHERAVFVLREVLDLEFAEIAAAVDRSEPACRQLLKRARDHVAAGRKRFPARAAQREAAARFLGALASGDVTQMIALLTDDVRAVADHGGKAKAARRIVEGGDHVARLLVGLARKGAPYVTRYEPAWVNGCPAVLAYVDDRLDSAVVLGVVVDADGVARIDEVDLVRNPNKLRARLARVAL